MIKVEFLEVAETHLLVRCSQYDRFGICTASTNAVLNHCLSNYLMLDVEVDRIADTARVPKSQYVQPRDFIALLQQATDEDVTAVAPAGWRVL